MTINPGDIYTHGSLNLINHVQLIISVNEDIIKLMTCVTRKNNEYLIFENSYCTMFNIGSIKLNV